MTDFPVTDKGLKQRIFSYRRFLTKKNKPTILLMMAIGLLSR